jgi:hypothetical protein
LDGKAREAIVKLLLTQDGVDSDFKSDMGRTPLPRPAANGYEAVVKLMLDTGKVNTKAKDTRYGRTPLPRAAENGYEAVVELLLGKDGVDPDSKSNSDWTPLSWAAEKEHKTVVKLLTDKGADVNANGGTVRQRVPGIGERLQPDHRAASQQGCRGQRAKWNGTAARSRRYRHFSSCCSTGTLKAKRKMDFTATRSRWHRRKAMTRSSSY